MSKRNTRPARKRKTALVDFHVHIPNLEGDAPAEIVKVRIPVLLDPDTGEELLTPEAVDLIESTKARYMGLLSPEEIRELRAELGLTQKQMSELIQAGEKSYTRWESGYSRPSRMVNLVLVLLRERKLRVDDLRDVQKRRAVSRNGAPRKKASRLIHA